MSQKIDADVTIRRFGFVSDEGSRRLVFPHATAQNIDGRSGVFGYGAKDLVFDGLEGRLDGVRWHAEAASLGEAWLRDAAGNLEMSIQRVELPRGIMLVRAESGVEIVAPHASLSDVTLTMHIPSRARQPAASAGNGNGNGSNGVPRGPMTGSASAPAAHQTQATQATGLTGATTAGTRQMQAVAPAAGTRQMQAAAAPPALRQERWHMLDGVAGKINLTIKAKLDLPVVGPRTLDQTLRIPIADGRLDYRALDKSLDWLEGTFVDLDVDDDRLAVAFKVPIFGASRDLISWALDDEAVKMARFGRVPLRSLVDFHVGSGSPGAPKSEDKKRSILRSLTLDSIEVALSMVAPRSLEVGGGTIMFGGDDAPGIVNFQIKGSINDHAAGFLRGTAGSVDTTIKDLHLGPLTLTADRFSFDRIEDLQVAFEGFTPTTLSATIHRVTASNLRLTMG